MAIKPGEIEPGSQPDTDVNDNGDLPADEPSSGSPDGGDKESLLDVARSVVADKDDDADESEQPEAEDAGSPAAEGGEDDGAESENFEDVPFNKHPRFQQLIRQRNEERDKGTRHESEIARLRPMAESYERIGSFLNENSLNAQQGQQALEVAALLQNDPVEAYKRLKPIVDNLAVYAGAGLFPEYEQAVKTGKMTRDMAVQLTRDRVQERQQTFNRDRDHLRNTRTAESDNAARQRNARAVSAWVSEKKASDPSFAAKENFLLTSVKAAIAEGGFPKSEQDAVAVVEKAYADLDKQLKQFAPAKSNRDRKPTRMAGGGNPTGAPTAKPSTMLEAAKLGLAKARSA